MVGTNPSRGNVSTTIPLHHADPFQLLVAVALSAQTTDARVNLVTPALFARAPTAAAMATVTVAELLGFIRTCGLAPTKARNLRALAQQLVRDHRGVVGKSSGGFGALTLGMKHADVFGAVASHSGDAYFEYLSLIHI